MDEAWANRSVELGGIEVKAKIPFSQLIIFDEVYLIEFRQVAHRLSSGGNIP